jgi:hypothetical protein
MQNYVKKNAVCLHSGNQLIKIYVCYPLFSFEHSVFCFRHLILSYIQSAVGPNKTVEEIGNKKLKL